MSAEVSNAEKIANTLRRHVAAEMARNEGETVSTLTPDCVFEDKTLKRRWSGREGAAEYYRMWWDAFQNTVAVDGSHITATGVVVAEVRFVGVHRGTFLGIPATERPIDLPVVIVVTGFRDGLMTGERLYWDLGTLMEQLGVTTLPRLSANGG